MKTDLFQSCGHCWVFPICWHTECSTFTASSFRIWNSSAGIPSSPLVLFVIMLLKAHLSAHHRMSGLDEHSYHHCYLGHLRSFLYSSVYSCHLFLISSAFVRSLLFLPFFVPIFAWNVPLVSPIFLKRFLVFPILLLSSISLYCSLKKSFLSLLAILCDSAFSWEYLSLSLLFFSQLFVRPTKTTTLSFCISFPWRSFWSPLSVQCYEPPSIVFQALYQI